MTSGGMLAAGSEVRVECDNQTYACTCFLGDEVAGTRQEEGPIDCDLYGGCCAALLVPAGD